MTYVPDDEEVLGVEGVPVHCHDSAPLEVVEHPEDHVGAPLLRGHSAAHNLAAPRAHHELGEDGYHVEAAVITEATLEGMVGSKARQVTASDFSGSVSASCVATRYSRTGWLMFLDEEV